MKHDLAQDIALMRYSMISPLIIGLPNEYDSKEAYFRAASERGAIHPNGSTIHPAPTSIKRWYQHYQKKGFDGLWCDNLDVYEYCKSTAMANACYTALTNLKKYGFIMVNGGAEFFE